MGPLTHAVAGGRGRDFSTAPAIRADRYDLQVDAGLASQATRLLDDFEAPAHRGRQINQTD